MSTNSKKLEDTNDYILKLLVFGAVLKLTTDETKHRLKAEIRLFHILKN